MLVLVVLRYVKIQKWFCTLTFSQTVKDSDDHTRVNNLLQHLKLEKFQLLLEKRAVSSFAVGAY